MITQHVVIKMWK